MPIARFSVFRIYALLKITGLFYGGIIEIILKKDNKIIWMIDSDNNKVIANKWHVKSVCKTKFLQLLNAHYSKLNSRN